MPSAIAETTVTPVAGKVDYRRFYVVLFLIAFCLRIICMLWWKSYIMHNNIPYNEVGRLVERLATGKGFTAPYGDETGYTAAFPPVYPFLGALIYRLFGGFTHASVFAILTLNCVFGSWNAVLIHELGLRTLGRRAALLAAWSWALFPVFFRWDISWIWEFSLSALLLTWVFILTMDVADKGTTPRWLGFGAAWGFASLANPALVTLLPFSGLYAAFRSARSGKRWLKPAVLSAVMFFAVLAPWCMRNYVIFHKFIFVRDNFWLEFQLGNFHGSTALGFLPLHPTGSARLLQRFHDLGELGYMEDRKQLAMDFVRHNRGEFRDLTLRRLMWFWDGTSVTYQANEWWQPWEVWWLSVLSLIGILFVLTRRPPGWVLYVATVVVYPLPYYVTYANAKYRHAIEPELALVGAYLLAVFWGEIEKKRRRAT